ncbi:DUF6152 family protein [Rhizorhabdus dicambivorans]|uniref:DUF5666 domain-containing protein n=1 Tax=Rhizorhabdus dicambivorans TaxID=1850238 RepID=A0A2A4G0X4_9SPHN|nr:DUF6152 family protein [Rhizorhabdus dicambivorans]ATE63185.1 hypothetical protein CMV14_01220 [Rhizorhabdus dicambivorans]PCE43362.1 hypothetical protein COO09_06265 [Rhizorhabdus dicambivorans]
MKRLALSVLLLSLPAAVPAHHGWAWTTGKNIEIAGRVVEAKLGNPHGVVILDVQGARWTVEVGQPWRNERAGLKDRDFAAGVRLRIAGEPSADPKARLIKAERIFIGDRRFDLYPERD